MLNVPTPYRRSWDLETWHLLGPESCQPGSTDFPQEDLDFRFSNLKEGIYRPEVHESYLVSLM